MYDMILTRSSGIMYVFEVFYLFVEGAGVKISENLAWFCFQGLTE
jgi:hypothetical protein